MAGRLSIGLSVICLSLAIQAPGRAAAPESWSGVAQPNVQVSTQCRPMRYTVTVAGSKVTLHVEFTSFMRDVEADLMPDGSFNTSITSTTGNTVRIFGKIQGEGGVFSYGPRGFCGFKDISFGQ